MHEHGSAWVPVGNTGVARVFATNIRGTSGTVTVEGIPGSPGKALGSQVAAAVRRALPFPPEGKTILTVPAAAVSARSADLLAGCFSAAVAAACSRRKKAQEKTSATIFIAGFGPGQLLVGAGNVVGVLAAAKRQDGITGAVVSRSAAAAALLVADDTFPVWAAGNVSELVGWISGNETLPTVREVALQQSAPIDTHTRRPVPDLSMLQGTAAAAGTKALVVAAAGGHHLLVTGDQTARTMLLAVAAACEPPLEGTLQEEVAAIEGTISHRVLGPPPLVTRAPCVRLPPAASWSVAAGMTTTGRAGLIHQAHGGVLVIDELAQVGWQGLSAVTKALSTGKLAIGEVIYPACFRLAVGTHPCRCGALLPVHCCCPQEKPRQVVIPQEFWQRFSVMAALDPLGGPTDTIITNTGEVQKRINAARRRAAARWAAAMAGSHNSTTTNRSGRNATPASNVFLTNERVPASVMKNSYRRWPHLVTDAEQAGRGLRAVGILRLAWTMADLEDASYPTRQHIDQALGFSPHMSRAVKVG